MISGKVLTVLLVCVIAIAGVGFGLWLFGSSPLAKTDSTNCSRLSVSNAAKVVYYPNSGGTYSNITGTVYGQNTPLGGIRVVTGITGPPVSGGSYQYATVTGPDGRFFMHGPAGDVGPDVLWFLDPTGQYCTTQVTVG